MVSALVILSGRPGEGRTPGSADAKGFVLPEIAARGKWAPGEGERGWDQLLFAPVLLLPAAPSQTSDRESAHPAHRGLASRPEPRLPWRWVRPEPTGLIGPTGLKAS